MEAPSKTALSAGATAALPRRCPLWSGGSASAFPDSLPPDERAPPRTRLRVVTTLLQESGHRTRPEISFRTRLSGNTEPGRGGSALYQGCEAGTPRRGPRRSVSATTAVTIDALRGMWEHRQGLAAVSPVPEIAAGLAFCGSPLGGRN